MRNTEEGKVGWILLWALGVPIPILVVLFARIRVRTRSLSHPGFVTTGNHRPLTFYEVKYA